MTDKTILVVDNDTYILKKVRNNKTIAEIKVNDKAKKDGLTRDDMVSIIGDTSNFTKAEIENNLFSKFQNVNNSGNQEEKASYRQVDNEYRFTTAKKFSFGSLFDTVENRQAPAPVATNTNKTAAATNSTGNLSNPMNNPAVQIANTFVNNPALMPSPYSTNSEALDVYKSSYMDAVNGLNFGFGNLSNMYATLFNYFSKMFGAQNTNTAAVQSTTPAATNTAATESQAGNTQKAGTTDNSMKSTSTDNSSESSKAESSDSKDETLNKTSYVHNKHHRHNKHYSIYSNDTEEHKKSNIKTLVNKEGQTVKKTRDKNGNIICKFSRNGKNIGESIYYKNSKNNKIKYVYPNGNYETKYSTKNGRIIEKCSANGMISSKSIYFNNKRLEYNFATKKCTLYEDNQKVQVLPKTVAETDMKILFGQTYPLV